MATTALRKNREADRPCRSALGGSAPRRRLLSGLLSTIRPVRLSARRPVGDPIIITHTTSTYNDALMVAANGPGTSTENGRSEEARRSPYRSTNFVKWVSSVVSRYHAGTAVLVAYSPSPLFHLVKSERAGHDEQRSVAERVFEYISYERLIGLSVTCNDHISHRAKRCRPRLPSAGLPKHSPLTRIDLKPRMLSRFSTTMEASSYPRRSDLRSHSDLSKATPDSDEASDCAIL